MWIFQRKNMDFPKVEFFLYFFLYFFIFINIKILYYLFIYYKKKIIDKKSWIRKIQKIKEK